MLLKKTLPVCLTIFLIFCLPAKADDVSDARTAGVAILQNLEQRKNSAVWEAGVSDWFKQRMTRDAFLANMTTVQSQLGGAATERKLVQQNKSDSNPPTGYSGPVYSFMYSTKFPAAKTYETIVLLKEGGLYKVSGLNWIPNPND